MKIGDRVEAGEPGTDDFDHGEVIRIRVDGMMLVRWEIAEEDYWEDPANLRPEVRR